MLDVRAVPWLLSIMVSLVLVVVARESFSGPKGTATHLLGTRGDLVTALVAVAICGIIVLILYVVVGF